MKNIFNINLLRPFVILLLIIIFATGLINYANAFLMKESFLKNRFNVGTVNVEISETFDGVEKKDVFVTNKGNVDVYIRAAISISWVNEAGTILPEIPEETDYSLTVNSELWIKGSDGFFYYKKPVGAGENSADLIERCKQEIPYTDRQLVVDVIAQSIQTIPVTAVEKAWNVTVDANHFITPIDME